MDRHIWIILAVVPVCLLIASRASAQSVVLPATHRAYGFLERVESKGLLSEYRDAVRPLSRKAIALHLIDLSTKEDRLTSYERNELQYLKGEFYGEIEQMGGSGVPAEELRWDLVSIPVYGGQLRANLQGGYRVRLVEGNHASNRQAGFQIIGNIFDDVGYYFNFVSSRETGSLVSLSKVHSPEQGVAFFNTPENVGGYEYSTTDVMLSYDIGPMTFGLEKTNNVWGEDRYGNVVLSSKSPSFPKLTLHVDITDWLELTYIHGDLHSLVVDSSRSYIDMVDNGDPIERTVYRQKYIASHILQFSPWDWMDVGLGESVIYSDRDPQLMFLLPIMFFKSGEHYNRDTDNTHFFGTVDVQPYRGISMYTSLFIDELAVGDIFDADKNRNWVAVSLGARIYDHPIENLELFLEYSRTNPWVYTHKYKSTTYSNNGYALGHWIGQNADLFSVEARFRPTRNAVVSLLYQRYRKGDTLSTWHQYNPPTEQFLFGDNRTETSLTLSASYEFMRDAFAEIRYRYGTLSDQHDPLADYTGRNEFLLRIQYGIW